MKPSSTSILASSGATSKRMTTDMKRYRTKENLPRLNQTIGTTKLPMKIPTSSMTSNKKPVKSVADAVMSYLHYKGAGGEPLSGRINQIHRGYSSSCMQNKSIQFLLLLSFFYLDAPHPSEPTIMVCNTFLLSHFENFSSLLAILRFSL